MEPPIVIHPKRNLLVLPGTRQLHPLREKLTLLACLLSENFMKNEDFLRKKTDIIMLSWRDSSRKQYDVHIRKWLLFWGTREIDPVHADIKDALEFLADMFGNNFSYSSINSALSALSAILQTSQNHTFGEHPDVKRFMKGIYQIRPPMPRYNKTWDVNIVLQYLQSMDRATELSIKDLTLKLVMLTALTTAGREQTLRLLNLEGMVKDDS